MCFRWLKSGFTLMLTLTLVAALPQVAVAAKNFTVPDPLPPPDKITTRGPDGDIATWYDQVQLTPEEVEKVRSMNLTAAYELVTESEWSRANLRGFKDASKELNIEVVGVASAELDPIKQKNNMESFASLDPDIITSQPQEVDLAASTFDPLVEQGVNLVFLSNVPTGYEPGKQYVSALTDSLVQMGKDAADLTADALEGEGEILTITVAGKSYVTNTRDDAYREAIKNNHPGLTIAEDGGFQKMSEAGRIANGLLTRHPEADAIYVSFSTPAVDVLEAVKGLGRDEVDIITMDLESVTALNMARGGNVYGYAIDLAYSMGYARAILGAYGAIDKQAPKYVTSPSYKVTRDNLAEGWRRSFGQQLPEEIKNALESSQ